MLQTRASGVQKSLSVSGRAASLSDFFSAWSGGWKLLSSVTNVGERRSISYYRDPSTYLQGLVSQQSGDYSVIDSAIGLVEWLTPEKYQDMAASNLNLPNNSGAWAKGTGGAGSNSGSASNTPGGMAMRDKKIYLGEHHLYGAQRLGVRKYWAGQYYSSWDWPQNGGVAVVDTTHLNVRQPWYSGEYLESISPATVSTAQLAAGTAQTQPYTIQHSIGQTGYEWANHLGNVMAVVSDKRYEKDTDNNGSIDRYAPSLMAAYDYYPYGMLMPGRYTNDTSSQCMLVTTTKLVPVWVYDPNLLSAMQPVKNGGLIIGTTGFKLTAPGTGDGATQSLTVQPGMDRDITLRISDVEDAEFRVSISELRDNTIDTGEIASLAITREGEYRIPFIAHSSTVFFKIVNNSLRNLTGVVDVSQAFGWKQVLQPQTVVTKVCNGAKDGYPFGFNGQRKTNEIAGKGNHNTALFWEYDTRLARRWNLDPVVYQNESPYATFHGNPILLNDPNGDCTKCPYKDRQGNKFAENKDGSYELEDVVKVGHRPTSATASASVGLAKNYSETSAASAAFHWDGQYNLAEAAKRDIGHDDYTRSIADGLHNAVGLYMGAAAAGMVAAPGIAYGIATAPAWAPAAYQTFVVGGQVTAASRVTSMTADVIGQQASNGGDWSKYNPASTAFAGLTGSPLLYATGSSVINLSAEARADHTMLRNPTNPYVMKTILVNTFFNGMGYRLGLGPAGGPKLPGMSLIGGSGGGNVMTNVMSNGVNAATDPKGQ